jgi:Rrf2 family protein
MLALTRRTEYALIAVTYMARNPERVISAREIARRHRVPLPLLMNVLKILSNKKLVSSVRGAKGGYRLAEPPAEISLARIIEAVEGPLRLVQCAGPRTGRQKEPCERTEFCPVRKPVQKLHLKLKSFFGDVSLADIAAEPAVPAAR